MLSGTDTLQLFWKAPVGGALLDTVRAAKAAQAADPDLQPIVLQVADHDLEVKRHGTRSGPLLLESEAVSVKLNPSPPKGLPSIMVEISAWWLWQVGEESAAFDAQRIAEDFASDLVTADAMIPHVTRIDLCADFQGWIPTAQELADLTSRSRDRGAYWTGKSYTGAHWGKGEMRGRVYDKTAEIVAGGNLKRWFHKLWARSPDFQKDEPVWRIELQARREGITALGETQERRLDSYRDLRHHRREIWRYFTRHWLVERAGRTKHTRDLRTPRWDHLAEHAFAAGDQPCPEIWRHAREDARGRVCAQLAGWIARAHAGNLYEGGRGADLDASVWRAYLDAKAHAQKHGESIEEKAQRIATKWKAQDEAGQRAKKGAAQ